MAGHTEQEERYFTLLAKDHTHPTDNYRQALFHIFAGSEDLYSKVEYFYDFKDHSIIPEGLEEVDLSSSSWKMVKLAFNLYNGYPSDDPLTLLSGLDDQNFEVCLRAMRLRFGK